MSVGLQPEVMQGQGLQGRPHSLPARDRESSELPSCHAPHTEQSRTCEPGAGAAFRKEASAGPSLCGRLSPCAETSRPRASSAALLAGREGLLSRDTSPGLEVGALWSLARLKPQSDYTLGVKGNQKLPSACDKQTCELLVK